MAIIKTRATEPEDEPVIKKGIIPSTVRAEPDVIQEPEEPEGYVATAKPNLLKKVATTVCILFVVIVAAGLLFNNGLGLTGSSSKLNESTLFIQFDKSIRMTSLMDLSEKKVFNLQDSLDKATLIDDEVVTASLSLALEKNIDSYNGYIERLASKLDVLFQEYEKSQAQAEDKLLRSREFYQSLAKSMGQQGDYSSRSADMIPLLISSVLHLD